MERKKIGNKAPTVAGRLKQRELIVAAERARASADVKARSEQPTALQDATARRSARTKRVPFRNDAPQPLERLARLNGRGSFQLRVHTGKDKRVITRMRDGAARKMIARPADVPRGQWQPPFEIIDGVPPPTRRSGSRSTVTMRDPEILDDSDLRHACGFASDKIGSDIAMAIATERIDIPARKRILAEMFIRARETIERLPRNSVRIHGAMACCLRVVVSDVFHDLVWLRDWNAGERGQQTKLRPKLYARLHNITEGCMLAAGNSAASEIMSALRPHD